MAYKALIFGVDDLFAQLQPLYNQAVQRGTLEIVAYAILEQNDIHLVTPDGKRVADNLLDVQLAIISSANDFYRRMKILEAHGFTRNQIIDGRVFQVPELNFPRLLAEGVAYGVIEDANSFKIQNIGIYPQMYTFKNSGSTFFLDTKSYISENATIERNGNILVGKFSPLSWNILFEFELNIGHNKANISQYSRFGFDWHYPKEFISPQGRGTILIGNDVWIGRGCKLKCTNPNKPLVIGDGAVIASDSVVVKSVPPYAIVGGNPAKIIKYRFEPHIIEALQRIKWWDWSLDKIHDNFKYFNDIEKFIAMHDKG